VNFSYFIAKRYLLSKSGTNAINIITRIAGIGIVLGAMALFIVLSGFSGLKDFSLQFTTVSDSDLKVYPAIGKTLDLTTDIESKLNKLQGVSSYCKTLEERIFIQYKGKHHIAYIKGVDTTYANVVTLDSIVFAGDWFDSSQPEIVLGLTTVHKLSLGIRDYSSLVNLYVPKPGKGQITALNASNAFKKDQVVVSGIYQINEDLDDKFAFTDLHFAQNLLGVSNNTISALEIKMTPNYDEQKLKQELQTIFTNQTIQVKNRVEQNDALYKMLNTENIAVYLIFTLVLIIALFNVVGSIIMMILDKRKNLKTLYNLGASILQIQKIFFIQGVLLTLIGGVLGIVLGLVLVTLQLEYTLINITPTLPYPVKITLGNVLLVFVTLCILGTIASKIASKRVQASFILR